MIQRTRRRFLVSCLSIATTALVCVSTSEEALAANDAKNNAKYVIGYLGVDPSRTSLAHVPGFISPDGTGERYPKFGQPNQISWSFGPQSADLRRIVFNSYEDVDITKVRAGKVTTRNWSYDLSTGEVKAILQKNRPSQHVRAYAFLEGDTRIIATAIVGTEERVFVMDLDGSNQIELTSPGSGFHYGLSISGNKKLLALHVTGGNPSFYNKGAYSINVFNLETKKRTLIATQPHHLYFGPHWSPDDRRLVYMDCLSTQDPQHFAAALCVAEADGSAHRIITPPQTHWFGSPYGSNMPVWSPDGKTVTYTRLLKNSRFDMSQGGTQVCLINPQTGKVTELTTAQKGKWDFRPAWSSTGRHLTFTRVHKGGLRELWMMNADGSHQKRITKGYKKNGADFSQWLRLPTTKK